MSACLLLCVLITLNVGATDASSPVIQKGEPFNSGPWSSSRDYGTLTIVNASLCYKEIRWTTSFVDFIGMQSVPKWRTVREVVDVGVCRTMDDLLIAPGNIGMVFKYKGLFSSIKDEDRMHRPNYAWMQTLNTSQTEYFLHRRLASFNSDQQFITLNSDYEHVVVKTCLYTNFSCITERGTYVWRDEAPNNWHADIFQ